MVVRNYSWAWNEIIIASAWEAAMLVIKIMTYTMRLLPVDKIVQASQKFWTILIIWTDLMMWHS